ncbi:MAG TPA: hypothetical protein VNO17_08980 [Actinomycetota bacterium]|nr:hypothetical protein [Actinomycetota bacterium]
MRLARAVGAAVLLVAVGEAGHRLLEGTGWGGAAAHHAFHLVYALGAVAAFLVWAIRDVRRHGMPRFAWSLSPRQEGASEGRTA